jgi:hypothetical protein
LEKNVKKAILLQNLGPAYVRLTFQPALFLGPK